MKLFCLGDSLTFGFGMSRNVRWTTLVEQETGWQVVNRGINGDTTGGMLARLGPEVLTEYPASSRHCTATSKPEVTFSSAQSLQT